MQTITFYSYKGGVGRTLALANIAIYLSRFGRNVCIMDFDLEAPGLHYKFQTLAKAIEIKRGLVDYVYEFTHNKVIPRSLKKFVLELIPSSKSQGRVQLFPAGDVLSSSYWQRLASVDWHGLFYEENSEGVPFFLELKERIRKKLDPDFLLIDSRTGITEMSGLCTSLLPDKVIFLIVNNEENIDGARQILRSIQRVERLPNQKAIEVTFALTRIPFSEDDDEMERQIVKDIRDFLNEPVEDLESQLDIQDICILHSDRELELSESLRMGQELTAKEMPLLRDYLRLFSKIIPNEAVLPELDRVLENITTTANLLEDPDRTQRELEELVKGYLQPKTLEKLIDFYILRNVEKGKILNTFHNLWQTFGIDTLKTLSKYSSLFMTWDRSPWKEPKFELAIIEKYVESNPKDRIAIEKRLAAIYMQYGKNTRALKHYLRLLDKVKDKNEILGRILDIYIREQLYDDGMKLCENYSDIIDGDASLRVNRVEFVFRTDNIEKLQQLLDDGGTTEKALSEAKPIIYMNVMERLGKEEKAYKKLNGMLNSSLAKRSPRRLLEIGEIFYGLDRADEFRNKITGKRPDSKQILRELEHRYPSHRS